MNDDQQNLNDNPAEQTKPTSEQESPSEQPDECPNCAALKDQIAEYKAGWQRAVADYKNLQKETRERRQEWVEMSELQILEEFIPVYDNFRKAWNMKHETFDGNAENWAKGISFIMKQFGDILQAHKIEEIKTVGEKFDPQFHESISEEESDKEHGTILREVDGGYLISGRVIKAAKVVIAK